MKALLPSLVLFLQTALLMPPRASAQNEIGYVERFALAGDRDSILQELIPGAEDYYYFHALHFQVQGRCAEFDAILEQWRKRFPDSGRFKPFEDRQALIDYSSDPAKTLDYLKRELGLSFDHQREQKPGERALPSRLDPAEVSREAFLRRATAGREDLGQLEDSALNPYLRSGAQLSPAQLREVLQRVSRPGFPRLTELVLAELALPESGGFGSLPIHQALLRDQLDALAESRLDLLANPSFVHLFLSRLAPNDDVALSSSPAIRLAYFEALHAFTATLQPSFNLL
ncbi:MAG TPA: hypothetical protein VMN36_18950, partial [Verrucomicrobiales bacterium]|nr:hypothetical protein [Verrucomicrobiales bacterium]